VKKERNQDKRGSVGETLKEERNQDKRGNGGENLKEERNQDKREPENVLVLDQKAGPESKEGPESKAGPESKETNSKAEQMMVISSSCSYECDGWPTQNCKMKTQFNWATCIPPYPPNRPIGFDGKPMKYMNYPTCASIPSGCNRCDDECAKRDGKGGKDDY